VVVRLGNPPDSPRLALHVAGWDAVEVLLKNGKKIRIGTDEPEKLSVAIDRAIG